MPPMKTKSMWNDLEAGATVAMRRWCERGLDWNCTFVDDDMRLVVGLAQRAVLAGLATDFPVETQERFRAAAEKARAEHEASLGRQIAYNVA